MITLITHHKYRAVAVVLLIVLMLVVAGIVFYRRHPRKLKQEDFVRRWKELQKLLAHKETWNDAIINGDRLLDDALRKAHFKGKTMGERLVSAEKSFTHVDGVWFGHKLCNRLKSDTPPKLRVTDVKKALLGLGQGLRDIGAIK